MSEFDYDKFVDETGRAYLTEGLLDYMSNPEEYETVIAYPHSVDSIPWDSKCRICTRLKDHHAPDDSEWVQATAEHILAVHKKLLAY